MSLRIRPVTGPFALTQTVGHADHLHCVNRAALKMGLHKTMPLADARAILPDLQTRPADLHRDRQALRSLCRWIRRYAPQVAIEGEDGLIADITGVAHLFGGEAELRCDLHDRLSRHGLALRSAIAGSRGGAYAMSRYGRDAMGGDIIPDGLLAQRLGPLPIAALRLPDETCQGLAKMGLHRIADLIPLPRAPLARRFGTGVVRQLDAALGSLPEPVGATPEPPHFAVRMTLPEPIGLTEDVMAGLARLLTRLCTTLAGAQMGARRLRLELHRVDKATLPLEIGLARPMRDAERMAALFRKGVEAIDAGYGIETLRLEAILTEPLAPEQIGNHKAQQEDDLADLISRLGNRVGFDHVLRLVPSNSLIPERSFRLVPAAYSAALPQPHRPRPKRPAFVFAPEPLLQASGHPPARFRWRGMSLTTLRAIGPERITPEWWHDDPLWRTGLRDYWRINTQEGPRLWLFHTPQAPNWYVQGEFL